MGDARRRRTTIAALAAILAGGLALRIAGLAFGLPAVYNPDEVAIMNRAVALGQNGLNPHNFLYPTLYFYALFAWEGLLFVAGWLAGRFASLAAFEQQYFLDPTLFYLAGRMLSVVCGALAIWATWRLGARLFGRIAGLAAATLLAVAPLAVRDAHYVKHDVPVTLLIVLTHLVLARGLTGVAPRWWLAGALAGLSMSTHYYAAFVLVPLVIVLMWPAGERDAPSARATRTAGALAIALVVFFAASPFLLVEPATAYRDIVANRQIVVDRATGDGGAFASLAFYAGWLASEASGSVAAALAAAGLVALVRTGLVRIVLTFAFPITFLAFMANTVPASRYLNPVLPFVALLGGAAIAWLSTVPRAGRWLAASALTVAVAEAAVASVGHDRFFRQDDTRTQALRWMATHVPSGASVLIQPYSVPLTASREGLEEALVLHLGDARRASVKFQRQLALDPYPVPAYRTIYLGAGGLDVDKIYVDPRAFETEGTLEPLRRLRVTHVVMKRYNVEDPAMAAIDAALHREGKLTATFSPYRPDADAATRRDVAPFLHNTDARIDRALERPGPIIDVWTID